ncbi:hypothetical protein MKX42_14580 [Paenibacillus sp. FSL R7-0204]|uniref:hypothetical protein n=1 Tax=Paenibacillus sp. FSL R7-0204 TaxID=2921675 RepID=UPI0030FAF39A
MPFSKSDLGAQASWKGYSSQTLYIASRVVADINSLEYFPEHLEDLLIKSDDEVSEIVQIKDLGSDLSISSLASTSASLKNEGFFRRVLSLRKPESKRIVVKVVHFGELGDELEGFINGVTSSLESIKDKLVRNHHLLLEEVEWITERMIFEKVDKEVLQLKIAEQIKSHIPTMIAPSIMQDLLIQYISDLSKNKGYTSKSIWQEKIHQIGRDMASIDGYFREYGSSLIRLSDIENFKSFEEMKLEYEQGISAHPAHIRFSLDFERIHWLEKIEAALVGDKVVIVKGASGQGKTSLCYKYLIKNYAEELVFCIRQLQTQGQAENLVKAIFGLSKHSTNIILYIDVNPGQTYWTWLIRELQIRGIYIPLLISIREEDFKQSNVDQNVVSFEILELSLTQKEAQKIYDKLTVNKPHELYRTFDEAWQKFGGEGPLLEFMYLLNNHQTLKQRLTFQINRLIDESVEDSWLDLLVLVCYVGRVDGSILFERAKKIVQCSNTISALRRMSDEYLVRSSVDGKYIESLHSIRAEILYSILIKEMRLEENEVLLKSLACVDGNVPQVLLFYYFTNNEIEMGLIGQIAGVGYPDWVAYGRTLNAMLWLDVMQYVDQNKEVFDLVFKENGSGWPMFVPMDITGEIAPGKFAAFDLLEYVYSKTEMFTHLEMVKESLHSHVLSYLITDKWLDMSVAPKKIPMSDLEWTNFGYVLYWASLRKKKCEMEFSYNELLSAMIEGKTESKIDATLGLFKQGYLKLYDECEIILRKRLIHQHNILLLDITDEEVICYFIPPYFQNPKANEVIEQSNHYWTKNMVGLLDRLYPNKEFITVELLGVDIFRDFGINSFDNKRRISKENRRDWWITQVNSWLLMRVNLKHRHDNWDAYIKEIISLRKTVFETLSDFKNLIEFFYKHKYWNVSKSKSFFSKLDNLKLLMRKEYLLPIIVVDNFGISSEGFKEVPSSHISTSISTHPYKEYRKHLQGVISAIGNFFAQFHEVIVARQKGEEIESNLSLINLYEASKSMFFLQVEFEKLFRPYLNNDYFKFAKIELDEFLINLNMWESVLEQKPRGVGLIYSAREKMKITPDLILQNFQDKVSHFKPDITIIDTYEDNTRFVIYNGIISETSTVEDQYYHFCLEFKDLLKKARNFNNSRWIVETSWPDIVFVPLLNGLPILGGFKVPLYQLIGKYEIESNNIFFPVILSEKVYDFYNINSIIYKKWREMLGEIGSIRLRLLQYNQIIEVLISLDDNIIKETLENYLEDFLSEISGNIKSANTIILEVMKLLSSKESYEAVELICNALQNIGSLEFLNDFVSELQVVEGIPEALLQSLIELIQVTPYLKSGSD